jgi:hypothetical protein
VASGAIGTGVLDGRRSRVPLHVATARGMQKTRGQRDHCSVGRHRCRHAYLNTLAAPPDIA